MADIKRAASVFVAGTAISAVSKKSLSHNQFIDGAMIAVADQVGMFGRGMIHIEAVDQFAASGSWQDKALQGLIAGVVYAVAVKAADTHGYAEHRMGKNVLFGLASSVLGTYIAVMV